MINKGLISFVNLNSQIRRQNPLSCCHDASAFVRNDSEFREMARHPRMCGTARGRRMPIGLGGDKEPQIRRKCLLFKLLAHARFTWRRNGAEAGFLTTPATSGSPVGHRLQTMNQNGQDRSSPNGSHFRLLAAAACPTSSHVDLIL